MTTETPIYNRLLDEFANTYPCKGNPREGGYYPGCDCIKCQAWKLNLIYGGIK